ncbi:MAG: YgjP-like metallopeptidase domain-containing protein [Candidatus Nomurabacteria bacterium]
MKLKSIKLNNQNIDYILKVNKRSRNIRLAIHPGAKVTVTTPRFVPQFIVDRFLKDQSDWLLKRMEYFSKLPPVKNKKEKREEYLKYKEDALILVKGRLEHFNRYYNLKWNNITVRNQKTRWGSCSRKGNLNFNYKIIFLSEEQSDYIIVHELCHLKELNHSKDFWKLVGLCVPTYKSIRSSLVQNSIKLS